MSSEVSGRRERSHSQAADTLRSVRARWLYDGMTSESSRMGEPKGPPSQGQGCGPSDIIAAMPEREAGAKKVFTYDEAVRLLPEVRRITDTAYREVEAVAAAGASEAVQSEVEAVVTRWAHELMGLGLEVKGLWLVDFDNGSGYYCWQYPEEGLQFFHTYEEGFRGRMRIH
jgi:hypothetical protein